MIDHSCHASRRMVFLIFRVTKSFLLWLNNQLNTVQVSEEHKGECTNASVSRRREWKEREVLRSIVYHTKPFFPSRILRVYISPELELMPVNTAAGTRVACRRWNAICKKRGSKAWTLSRKIKQWITLTCTNSTTASGLSCRAAQWSAVCPLLSTARISAPACGHVSFD